MLLPISVCPIGLKLFSLLMKRDQLQLPVFVFMVMKRLPFVWMNSGEKCWYSISGQQGCGACFRKFPDIETLHQHYANENVEVVAVNLLMRRDNPDSIVALTNRLPYSFGHYFTTRQSADSLRQHFGIQAVPNYVVINPAGRVIHNGRMTTERLTRVNNAYAIVDETLRKDAQNAAR